MRDTMHLCSRLCAWHSCISILPPIMTYDTLLKKVLVATHAKLNSIGCYAWGLHRLLCMSSVSVCGYARAAMQNWTWPFSDCGVVWHMYKTVVSENVTFMLYCSYFIFMRLPLSSSPGLGSLLFPNHLRSPEYHDTTWPSDYLPACLHDLKTHPYNFWWYTVALTLTSPFTIWCRSMIIEQASKIFHEL